MDPKPVSFLFCVVAVFYEHHLATAVFTALTCTIGVIAVAAS
jgi:hypothetical protein